MPVVEEGAFLAGTATVVGDVRIGKNASVWYGAVLRGDINSIFIGEASNLQDGVIGHLADDFPLIVGNMLPSDTVQSYMPVISGMNV